jgi:hypothetical protein
MALMALDLPAFDRPATDTSTPASSGNWCAWFALVRNFTFGYEDMGAGAVGSRGGR